MDVFVIAVHVENIHGPFVDTSKIYYYFLYCDLHDRCTCTYMKSTVQNIYNANENTFKSTNLTFDLFFVFTTFVFFSLLALDLAVALLVDDRMLYDVDRFTFGVDDDA